MVGASSHIHTMKLHSARNLLLLPLTLGIARSVPGRAQAQQQTVSPELVTNVNALVDADGERLTAIAAAVHAGLPKACPP